MNVCLQSIRTLVVLVDRYLAWIILMERRQRKATYGAHTRTSLARESASGSLTREPGSDIYYIYLYIFHRLVTLHIRTSLTHRNPSPAGLASQTRTCIGTFTDTGKLLTLVSLPVWDFEIVRYFNWIVRREGTGLEPTWSGVVENCAVVGYNSGVPRNFFRGGGFNNFSWGQRAERTEIWGR
jgi:hypothetical protein